MARVKGLQKKRTEQMPLFTIKDPEPSSEKNGGDFCDPAFASNKALPVHRWVPWIAGFSSDFVKESIAKYIHRRGTVLDPFCGVGTTLVDAISLGHNGVGFEINPYAAWVSKVKVTAPEIDVGKMRKEISRLQRFYRARVASGYIPKSKPPRGFQTRAEFYSPQVLHKVLVLHDFMAMIKDRRVREVFRLAFAATMVTYSNYSYEPSLGRRVSAGKQAIKDYPVEAAIVAKLTEIADDITRFQGQLEGHNPDVKIVNQSFFQYETYLAAESVDLIITSPPYLNNYHYNRNTRPHLYWLGFVDHPKDMKPLEQSNFGKFWQTVRYMEPVRLDFALPGTDIAERVETLRGLNAEKGVYGGAGWANYAVSYFNDCYTFAQGIKYTLRRGATALVVIGNSILQGVLIPTDQYFGKIAESVGLELLGIHIPRATRVGNSIIKSDVRVTKAKDSHQLYEAIVELRKK